MKLVISVSVPEVAFYFCKEQAGYFKENGFDVHIVTSSGTWTKDRDVAKEFGVVVDTFDITRVFSVLKDLKVLFHLIGYFYHLKPEYLYATTPKAALLTTIAAAITGVNHRVYLCRGLTFINDRFGKKALMSFFEWITCALAHKVLVVSRSNMDYLIEHGLCSSKKAKVLAQGSSHGVDALGHFNPEKKDVQKCNELREKWGIGGNDIVFVFQGRMVIDKGVEVLSEAWKGLREQYSNIHLVLIGPQDVPRDAVSDECYAYMRGEPLIHLTGDVRDTFYYYAIGDVLVHPSFREGFPNAVLEGAAMELPAITTNALGCIDSVIENETGIIVPVKDAEALKSAMACLIDDKELRIRLGKNARKRVLKDFDPAVLAQQVFKFITGENSK